MGALICATIHPAHTKTQMDIFPTFAQITPSTSIHLFVLFVWGVKVGYKCVYLLFHIFSVTLRLLYVACTLVALYVERYSKK